MITRIQLTKRFARYGDPSWDKTLILLKAPLNKLFHIPLQSKQIDN